MKFEIFNVIKEKNPSSKFTASEVHSDENENYEFEYLGEDSKEISKNNSIPDSTKELEQVQPTILSTYNDTEKCIPQSTTIDIQVEQPETLRYGSEKF